MEDSFARPKEFCALVFALDREDPVPALPSTPTSLFFLYLLRRAGVFFEIFFGEKGFLLESKLSPADIVASSSWRRCLGRFLSRSFLFHGGGVSSPSF